MAQTIKLKRSSVASAVPSLSSLELGEIAINTNDGAIYIKRDDGSSPLDILAIHHEPTMHIDYTNNRIGIGTTSPASLLHLSTASPVIRIEGTAASSIVLQDTGASINQQAVQIVNDDGTLTFRSLNDALTGVVATAMTIENITGNVGIGTTSPDSRLSIESDQQLIARFASTLEDSSIIGLRLQGKDPSESPVDTVFVDWFYDPENRKYGFGEGTTSGDLPINSGLSHADIVFHNGNVGIGTSSPDHQLDIENSGNAIARLHAGTDSSASLRLQNDAHEWDVNCQISDKFAIYSHTDGTERLVILPTSGNVGIGTISPRQKLEVDGAIYTTGFGTSPGTPPYTSREGAAFDYFTGGARLWSWGDTSSPHQRGTFSFIQLENDGENQQTALSIDSSGNATFVGDVDVENGGSVRVYRSGNSAYGELSLDVGENLNLFNSWGNKYLRLTRDGHLQLSGTTRIAHNGDATLGTISSGVHTISTSSPDTTNTLLFLNANDIYSDIIAADDGGSVIYRNNRGSFQLFVDGIANSASTTNAQLALTVADTKDATFAGTISNSQFTIPNTAGTSGQVLAWPSSGTELEWTAAGATPGGSDTHVQYNSSGSLAGSSSFTFNSGTGQVTAVDFNSTSDERKKENVQTLDSENILENLRPVSFTWKESGKDAYGLIAQEVEKVLPEIVSENNEGIKSISYTQIIPFLIDEILKLKKEVEDLKNGL